MMTKSEHLLEECEAVMIGFCSRRFIIVRRDRPSGLRPIDGQKRRVRDLEPGDSVLYKGQLQVVHCVQPY